MCRMDGRLRDGSGRGHTKSELLLRTVVAPSLHCVQVVARKTGAAGSVVVELSQVRFRFAPLDHTVSLDIVVP